MFQPAGWRNVIKFNGSDNEHATMFLMLALWIHMFAKELVPFRWPICAKSDFDF